MRIVTDDFALWQSFKDGDRDSFQALYFSHFNSLYEYGIRIIGDKELVKDCIHDLYVKLWNNKSNLGDVSAIRSYLLVSLRSTLYNRIEQNNRKKTTLLDGHEHFDMVFSVESEYIRKENRVQQFQKVIEALNQLTPRQKEVIYLRYFEEMDYQEIAAIMNITVKATYKLSARGLETLRQVLNMPASTLLLLFSLARTELFS